MRRPAMMILMTPAYGKAAARQPHYRHGRDQVTDTLEQISGLLHEAGETHHRVFRIVDGADDDWASWEMYYARQILRHFRPSGS